MRRHCKQHVSSPPMRALFSSPHPLVAAPATCTQDQVQKLRDEREAVSRDLAVLRADLDNTRQERERAFAEAARSKDDLDK